MTFDTLGLHPLILKALAAIAYDKPTPVQEKAIPSAIAGKDLLVSSQTGSGKTAAFMLPALHRFASQEASRPVQAVPDRHRQDGRTKGGRPRFQAAEPKMLVLTPTRELALQIVASTDQYSACLKQCRTVAILGGMPYPKQRALLERNPEILVATPGRLIDHMQSGKIRFDRLEVLVLDEADRMLDMGFIDDIETITAATPDTRQTMLFSATLDGVVGNMARKITRNAETIHIASSTSRHENIEQMIHFVDDQPHKNRLLDHWLNDRSVEQALVFTATKRDADLVADRLAIAGFSAAALHGDMPQGARNRTLAKLRNGKVRILVATDVAARGIDVPAITHVFNYDLPKFPEDYVHRIGRTGRAGRHGLAISLVSRNDQTSVRRIERFTKQTIPVNVVEGFEPRLPVKTTSSRPRPDNWKPGAKRNRSKTGSQRHFGKVAMSGQDSGAKSRKHRQSDRRPTAEHRH